MAGIEWISVNEKTPDEGDIVLAFDASYAEVYGVFQERVSLNGSSVTIHPLMIFQAEYKAGGWFDLTWPDYGGEATGTDRVTHWMPLPQPPVLH